MKKKVIFGIIIVLIALFINSCENKEALPPLNVVPVNCDTAKMTYSTGAGEIQNILNTQCAVSSGCHAYGAPSRQGDFSSYSSADLQNAVSGGVNSAMYINLNGGSTPMPNVPQSGWSPCDKLKLEAWILAGAPQ